LTDDMNNWSSYGYTEALPSPEGPRAPARAEEELSLAGVR
jgi:hypothetical protein